MIAIYDAFLHVVDTFPPWLLALAMGWIVSATATHFLKFRLPFSVRPSHRAWVTRAIAFVTAAATTYALLPTRMGVLLAVLMGLWSPVFYRLFIVTIQNRYPKAADILSADVRGTLFGRYRYTQYPRTKKVIP